MLLPLHICVLRRKKTARRTNRPNCCCLLSVPRPTPIPQPPTRPCDRNLRDVELISCRLRRVEPLCRLPGSALQQLAMCGFYEDLEKGVTRKSATCALRRMKDGSPKVAAIDRQLITSHPLNQLKYSGPVNKDDFGTLF